ncbi:Uncharacterised protein [Mycobacteroides abscessus subsp. abscessus]|nr:Uncharacterised protein [Mycobacteroides abscessus subsp. abscessus]
MEQHTEQAADPVIQVSKGHPTDEEVAAAVTVLSLALAP